MSCRFLLLCLAVTSAAACGDDDPAAPSLDAAAAEPDAATAPVALDVPFAAHIAGRPFDCTASYPGVGTPAATYLPVDFRLFVHDVRVVVDGREVAAALVPDGTWQSDRVALMDFEDATGGCEMGTTGTHTTLRLELPGGTRLDAGADVALRFRVGVPMDLNHLDLNTSVAPLTELGMAWGWLLGYRHLKIDGATRVNDVVQGFPLHVGASGCPGDNYEGPPPSPCTYPNLLAIELRDWRPGRTIVADIADVLVGSDLTTNTPQTAPGCMSFAGDRECDAIFPRLGLAFESAAAGAQALFHVAP